MSMETAKNQERTIIDGALFYFGILWRKKWLIFATTAISTAAVAAFCLVSVALPRDKSPMPNYYQAEAILLIQPQSAQNDDISTTILDALGIDQGNRNASPAGFNYGELIIEVLRSRSLIDHLVAEFDLAKRYKVPEGKRAAIRSIVLGHSRFAYYRSTMALKIYYTDNDPVFARNVVNRYVSLLDQWYNQNHGMAQQKQKQTLEEKLLEVKNDIANLQYRLKSLQNRYGVLSASDLGATQAATLASLRSQLILKDVEIKNYSSFSKINDPRLEQLMDERKNLMDLIAQNQQALASGIRPGEESASKTVSEVAQEFTQLANELDIQQRIYNTLSPQYEAAKLAPESKSIFTILEMAETPEIKAGPKRSQYVMMAGLGGFVFGVAVALFLYLLDIIKKDPRRQRFLEGMR